MKTNNQLTNRILSLVLALVMVVGMLPMSALTASAAETEYDGVIGELYYKVDQENNITTIFGNGALSSVSSLANVMTSNVVIEEGVTSIGYTAFRGLSSLEKLTVKGDVTIGNYAFQGCASLETITFMGNVTSVGRNAFYGCASLTNINYYGTTEPSYENALSSVTLYSSKGVSFCGLTPSNPPATEASPLKGEVEFIAYEDGVTCYKMHENYLYKVTCTNLDRITNVRFSYSSAFISNPLILYITSNSFVYLYHSNSYKLKLEELPKVPGEVMYGYTDNWVIDPEKPVVTITCVAVGDPIWTWNGTSSATAKFISKDWKATMTVDATLGSAEQVATNCLEKSKVTYTATATANGKTYTNTKTVDGDIGPHNINYLAASPTVTANCQNPGCSYSSGNSVTLNPQDKYYYTGSPIPDPVTGGFLHGLATYKVTYNGSEDRPSAVGSYNVALNVYDENGTEKAGIGSSFKISYLPSLEIYKEVKFSGSSYDRDGVCWFKNGAVATVIAPEGYMISTALDGAYGAFVYFDEDDNKTVYFKRASDGAMTDAVDLSARLKWDTSAPTGRVELATGNFWTNLINKITFGMFFKERQTVTITAEDTESGVKSVQYYYDYEDLISDPSLNSAEAVAKLEAAIGNKWKDYNGSFELEFDGKYIVYVKLTDNVGNVTYISSNGLVQYSDATSATTSLTTTYKAGEDRDILVELNCNTVKEVKCGNAVLTAADYTVSGDKITLKSAYLDSLAAGDYTITISLNPQGLPYVETVTNEKPAELTVSLTVNKQEVAVPPADTQSFVYDGDEKTYNVASSEWYTVTDNKKTDAGTYIVTVVLKDKDNTVWSDGTTEDKTYEFYIAKADQAAPTGLTKTDTTYFGKADGKISGLTSAMEFRKQEDSAYTAGFNGTLEYLAAGTYYVRYQGDANHNPSPDAVVTVNAGRKLQIVVPQNQVGYTVTVNKTEMEYEGSYTLKVEIHEGYTATEDFKIIISNWECGQQAGVEETYMNAIADQIIEVRGVADITPPAAEIKVKENKWTSFWNNLTFGLFFKETQDVTITTTDKGSGVKSIQYYLFDRELERDEVRSITDWIDYNGTFKINPDNRYVIYVKVTDNAGNAEYINSEGIVLDATAPVLYGIENGGVYHGDKVFKATDENFLKIEVDGVDITDTTEGDAEFKIAADNAEHIVTVTDRAGNVTEYKVTVMKNYTVTYKADGEPISTETVGHGKDATLPAVPAKNGYVGKWDSDGKNITGDTTITVVYTEIPVVKPNEVKPEDKSELEDAKAKLEEKLKDDSYTDEDKKNIQDAIDDIDDALEVISNVEAVEELIDKLPDTIGKDDEAAIKAAEDALNALTEYEKSLVDVNVKNAFEAAKAALAELNKPADTDSPQTGDNSNMFLWIVLLFISGGAVITLTVVDRKRRMASNR